MKTLYSIILFIVVAVAQLAVPAQMIIGQEYIIKNGTAYKFKTQPVDPADPFKGKYIYLNYEINSFTTTDSDWDSQQDIYISITNDSLGFVALKNVSKTKPKQGDFVKAKVDWYNTY